MKILTTEADVHWERISPASVDLILTVMVLRSFQGTREAVEIESPPPQFKYKRSTEVDDGNRDKISPIVVSGISLASEMCTSFMGIGLHEFA